MPMLQKQRKQLTDAQALLAAITLVKKAIEDARASPAMTKHYHTVLGAPLKIVNDAISEITAGRDVLFKAVS